jgi:hypothetical protein
MTTISNPPGTRQPTLLGPIVVEGRLSDVAASQNDLMNDLVLPPLRVQDWAAVRSDAGLFRATIALHALRLANAPASLGAGPTAARQRGFRYDRLDSLEQAYAALADTGLLDDTIRFAAALRPTVERLAIAEFNETLDQSMAIATFLYDQYTTRPITSQNLDAPWFQIRDQRNTGGCVGYALADLLQRQRAQFFDVPSARFIWQAAKELDGEKRPTTMIAGAGTSLRAGLDVLRKYGCASELELPSDGAHLFSGGLAEFYRVIKRRKIHRFVNLGRDIKYRLAWLNLGRPIVCALVAGSNFLRPGASAEIAYDDPSLPGSFGHAAVIAGYRIRGPGVNIRDLVTTLDAAAPGQPPGARVRPSPADLPVQYLIRNAAGPSWGAGGYAWINHVDVLDSITEDYGIFCTAEEYAATMYASEERAAAAE